MILVLGLFVGCAKEEIHEEENINREETMVEISGEKFKLRSQNNLKDMYYNENYVDFHTDAVGNMRTMSYSRNGEYVFEVRLIYEDKHSFEEVKSLVKYHSSEKEVNGIIYAYYEYITDGNNKVHLYIYNYNNVTYSIMFIFKDDISDLENKFMNNIKFK